MFFSLNDLCLLCSLHSNSSLDIEVKGGMIKDLLNLAGFKVPNKGYGLG